MSKTIHVSLSTKGINAAIREIRKYKNELREKQMRLLKRISDELANEAQQNFDASQYDDIIGEGTRKPNVTLHSGQSNNLFVVIADGEEAVFVEFGSGVYHNGGAGSSPHPNGSEHGFVIGSYGKGNGARNAWGYIGDDGEIHITRGTKAQMPLYNATKSVIQKIPQIAREVFG